MKNSITHTLLFIFSIFLLSTSGAFAEGKVDMRSQGVLGEVRIEESTSKFEVDMKYPVMMTPKARQALRDQVSQFLAQFKLEFVANDAEWNQNKYQMLTEYQIWSAAQNRLTSVLLDFSNYTGGAHGSQWPVTWVFDLTTDSALSLKDIFTDPNAALKEIAPLVRTALKEPLGDMYHEDMVNSGTSPKINLYKNFVITDAGIIFIFEQYQVAPYAAGQTTVTIDWNKIAQLLHPQFKNIINK